MTEFMTTAAGRRLAYHRLAGQGPGVVFLGGFKSDMEGTKALFLAQWAQEQGRAFLRFDYSGHGQSSGAFEDGSIGDWAADARSAILSLTEGPQILVGSSMGGWISLLLAREMPERVAGLVGIAAAPDFTRRLWRSELSESDRQKVRETGRLSVPSEYGPEPLVFTRHLFEDGESHLVLETPLSLPFPVRLLQGTADVDVPPSEGIRLLDHLAGPDIRLILVKGADHRFSGPSELELLASAITEITG